MWEGSNVGNLELELRDGGIVVDVLAIPADGTFQFAHAMLEGSTYEVAIATNPFVHSCTATNARGTIPDSDVIDVVVECLGPSVTITTSGPWPWTFDPIHAVQPTIAVSALMQEVAITVDVHGELEIDGAPTTPRTPTTLALPLGPRTIPVFVTTPGGISRTFQLTFDRGAAVFENTLEDRVGRTAGAALFDDTLAVGVPSEDANSGAVYVYRRNGAAWAFEARLVGSGAGENAEIGHSVALAKDVLVVSAPGELSAGRVYVFRRTGTTWIEEARLVGANTETGDRFGESVGVSGNTLVVGAFSEDSANNDPSDNTVQSAGAAYIFERTNTTWTQRAYLKPTAPNEFGGFGFSVAISNTTVAVGAFGERSGAKGIDGDATDTSTPNSGAVYVYARNNNTWAQQAYIKASDAAQGDVFGYSVALAGDRLAVGAYCKNSCSGAAYVFHRTNSTWAEDAKLVAPNPNVQDTFGMTVAIVGDRIAVGAPFEESAAVGIDPLNGQSNNSQQQDGAVYLFERDAGQWSFGKYIKGTTAGRNWFGSSLAITSDSLVITASEDGGAVYTYR